MKARGWPRTARAGAKLAARLVWVTIYNLALFTIWPVVIVSHAVKQGRGDSDDPRG